MKKRKNLHHKKRYQAGKSRKARWTAAVVVFVCIASGILGSHMLKKGQNSEIENSAGASENLTKESERCREERESGRSDDSTESDIEAESMGWKMEETAVVLQKDEENSSVEEEPDERRTNTAGDENMMDALMPGTILTSDMLDMDDFSQYFTAVSIELGGAVYDRINGRSWQENSHIALSDLRYLKLLHYNFSGQIQVGEMIVNKDIADDVICIFEELFACGYQIQSMYLIDDYWTGDPDDSDTASIDANNTSAFCYRPVTNGRKLSNHAYGKAIDLNPQQNPYVSYSSGSPKWYHENANDYIARDTGLPHVITHEDTAFLIFQKYGFTWGGDWNNPKDYQHFERK